MPVACHHMSVDVATMATGPRELSLAANVVTRRRCYQRGYPPSLWPNGTESLKRCPEHVGGFRRYTKCREAPLEIGAEVSGGPPMVTYLMSSAAV